MRNSAALTTVAMLLGGCAASLAPQAELGHAPPPPAEQSAEASPAPQEPPPQPAARRPQAPRIDNTSLESFRVSWDRMLGSLSPTEQAQLTNAVVRLTFARYGGAAGIPANLRLSPIVPEIVRERIDGLTYTEIIALAP